MTIRNSLLTGNTAAADGGGIYIYGGTTTIVNTTIDGNAALETGGGIKTGNNSLTITNSTITRNQADSDGAATEAGGGIVVNSSSVLNLTNSVVAENTSGTGLAAHDVSGTIQLAQNSFIGTDALTNNNPGSIVNGGDPGLGELADNGGPVLTRNILSGSQLIDAGSSYFSLGITADANGNPRVVGSEIDIGATEAGQIVVTTLADVVDAGDGVISLREAVEMAGAGPAMDLITFDAALTGGVIALSQALGSLVLEGAVSINGDIDGDGKADISVSGGGVTRIVTIIGAATDAELRSLTLSGGYTSGEGGAIYAANGTLSIVNSTIRDSEASNGGQGGGLFSRGAEVKIANSLFTGNTAAFAGAATYHAGGTVTLVNTTLHGNTAGAYGGGMSAYGGVNVTITSSTITGNAAASGGGGIDNFSGTLTIVNTVMAENISSANADVFGLVDEVRNSVFETFPTINFIVGSEFNVADVGLGELLDNGGPTLTRSPLDGSILIGFGANSLIGLDLLDIDGDGNRTELLPLDGRGQPRVTGVKVDVGAVERIVNETIGGTQGNDIILGGNGNDVLSGRGGNDTINGGRDADIMDGGTGNGDTLSYAGSNAGVRVDLRTGSVSGGHANGDTITGFESVIGSDHSDVLTGNNGRNELSGGEGNDILEGGGGADVLNGGNGADTASYAKSAAAVTVNLLTAAASGGDAAGDTFLGIENLTGSRFADSLTGDGLANTLSGGGGLDSLSGGGSDDVLLGGTGNDILSGGAARDRLAGEAGNDTMAGGAGKDVFVLSAKASSADEITDYVRTDDQFEISAAEFGGGLVAGRLARNAFASNETGLASNADHRFIFNELTNELFYDSNGSASGGSRLIATFSTAPVGGLAASDFDII